MKNINNTYYLKVESEDKNIFKTVAAALIESDEMENCISIKRIIRNTIQVIVEVNLINYNIVNVLFTIAEQVSFSTNKKQYHLIPQNPQGEIYGIYNQKGSEYAVVTGKYQKQGSTMFCQYMGATYTMLEMRDARTLKIPIITINFNLMEHVEHQKTLDNIKFRYDIYKEEKI